MLQDETKAEAQSSPTATHLLETKKTRTLDSAYDRRDSALIVDGMTPVICWSRMVKSLHSVSTKEQPGSD